MNANSSFSNYNLKAGMENDFKRHCAVSKVVIHAQKRRSPFLLFDESLSSGDTRQIGGKLSFSMFNLQVSSDSKVYSVETFRSVKLLATASASLPLFA